MTRFDAEVAVQRSRLLLVHPFLGSLAMHLQVRSGPADLGTARTDGVFLEINPHWWMRLVETSRLFVLAHEVWHAALLHPWRRGNRVEEPWNLACDHEVNCLLEQEGFTLPTGAIRFPEMAHRNAETVYAWLLELKDWETFPGEESLAARTPPALGDDDTPPTPNRFQKRRFLDQIRKARPYDQHIPCDDQTALAWRAHTLDALRRMEQTGYDTASVRRRVKALHPVVDWRHELCEAVRDSLGGGCDWTRPQRRWIHRGLYLPGRRERRLDVAVLVDSSGSMGRHLPRVLGELIGILQLEPSWSLRLLMGDAQVKQDLTWTSEGPPDSENLEFVGMGGTDLRPLFQRLTESGQEERMIVVLTDGIGSFPVAEPPVPVVWALIGKAPAPVPWGRVVRVPASTDSI